jgi:hypothetical protein
MRKKKLSLKEAIQCLNNINDSDLEDVNLDGSEDEWLPSNSSDLPQSISDDEKETSDSEDEDDETTTKVVKGKKKPVRWSKKAFKAPNISFVNKPIEPQHTLESPYSYFSKYYCEDTFNDLAEKTNMYSISTSGNCVKTCAEEIKKTYCTASYHRNTSISPITVVLETFNYYQIS